MTRRVLGQLYTFDSNELTGCFPDQINNPIGDGCRNSAQKTGQKKH